MEFKDYYATLGVAKTASADEIKRAYRKLARKYHPDLNPGDKAAEAKFKDVNEANEVLGDPEKRQKYDELGANWRAYEQAPPTGGTTYRTMTPEEMQEIFGGGGQGENDPFSSFFHTFFGGRGPGAGTGRPGRVRRGQDLDYAVDLSLEDAFKGTTRRVMIGTNGSDRTVEVRIPAGVSDGMRVRAAGEGTAAQGGASGDLYLHVRVLPHGRFERRGPDLFVKVPVPVAIAVLGGTVSVPTLAGSTLRLRIPELTPGGRVFRLKRHGMPSVGKSIERGDLYATVEIEIPSATRSRRASTLRGPQETRGGRRMNLNKYTEKAQEAILAAQQSSERAGHPEVIPEHLLAALVDQQDGIVPALLGKMNVDPARVRTETRACSPSCRRHTAARRRGCRPGCGACSTPRRTKRHGSRTSSRARNTCFSPWSAKGAVPCPPRCSSGSVSPRTRCSRPSPPFAGRSA